MRGPTSRRVEHGAQITRRRNENYFRTASLSAFDGRKRTTVFALILIASPVWGLRPMRALRCALTTRPMPGITNLPALPLASFTASLKSSSKNVAAVFLGVPAFSAMCATILVLLKGLAAIFYFYPPQFFNRRRKDFSRPAAGSPPLEARKSGPHWTIRQCLRGMQGEWGAGMLIISGDFHSGHCDRMTLRTYGCLSGTEYSNGRINPRSGS